MENKISRGEEIGMLKETLLLLCNKTHEEFYSDAFLRAVITQVSILLGDLKYKTTEEYVRDYKETQTQLMLKIEELRSMGGMGPLEYEQKKYDAEFNIIRPFQVIKGAIDERIEKMEHIEKIDNQCGCDGAFDPDGCETCR